MMKLFYVAVICSVVDIVTGVYFGWPNWLPGIWMLFAVSLTLSLLEQWLPV